MRISKLLCKRLMFSFSIVNCGITTYLVEKNKFNRDSFYWFQHKLTWCIYVTEKSLCTFRMVTYLIKNTIYFCFSLFMVILRLLEVLCNDQDFIKISNIKNIPEISFIMGTIN